MLIAVHTNYSSLRRRMLVKLARFIKYCSTKQVYTMDRVNDKWLRITGLGVLNVILLLFIYPDMYVLLNYPFWKVALLSILYTWLTWELTRFIILTIRHKYPGIQNIRKRNILAPLWLVPSIVVLSVAKVYLTSVTGYYGSESNITIYSYLYAFGMNIIYATVIAGVYEVQYYFEQWKLSFAETQELKKENLQSQLDQLKNQVKPHFLFNSLNSLLALVDEDQQRAKKFIEELSFVYRYLLQCNDKELICVESELDFIKAFYFLLKTRFEDGLEIEIAIDDEANEMMLPPLTLQMLVENAVKHNMISKSNPLKIKIYTDADNNLVVSNNRQKKTLSVQSAKVGLSNISAKYRLLNEPGIIINETEQEFTIRLSLIKNEAA
jgi:sensor histidine kinase YesM